MAAPRLTGLTGLAGYQVMIDENAQATPEERNGNTADPRHAELGERAKPYSWESQMTPGGSHGPYGPENQLLGDEGWFYEPAGQTTDDPDFDHTPSTRAAPWPKGILSGPIPTGSPDNVAMMRVQSAAIHGVNMGASKRMQHSLQGEPRQDEWVEQWNVGPGHTDVQELGAQNKSAGFLWGTRDRLQSFARQNLYGFDSAHSHRRFATGSIPGNTMWMQPGGRALRKSLAGPARPAVGVDSPFHGDNLGQAFATGGAILQTLPSEYTAPPQPNLAAPIVDPNAYVDVEMSWY